MQNLKVYDPKGQWFVNTGKFSFVDPTNDCRFDPGVPTQVLQTDWVKAQSAVIKPWVDPNAKPDDDAKAKK